MSSATSPKISLQEVRKSFGQRHVLNGINLEINQSEVIAFIGSSGSGKSTLLRCINLLESIDDGAILLDGIDISEPGLNPDPYRRCIGMVFQNFNLFPHMTVIENIALAPRKVLGQSKTEANDHARELIDRLGLSDRADGYPDQLSGGQQQRVAIARALVHEPPLVICDEPTAALDAQNGEIVLELFRNVARTPNRAVIIVTHDNRIFSYADRIARMDDGEIVDVSAQKSTPHFLHEHAH